MLWIFIGIGVVLVIIGAFITIDNPYKDYGAGWVAGGLVIAILFGIIATCVCQSRHSTINNTGAQIVVLEENNKELLAEIGPVVEKYLNYETGTFEKMKVDGNTIVAYSMYPELKGDTFIAEQISIIKKNNEEIKNKKLALASLEKYRMWIFMGDPNIKER